jgi:hypothetical protein
MKISNVMQDPPAIIKRTRNEDDDDEAPEPRFRGRGGRGGRGWRGGRGGRGDKNEVVIE